MGPSIIDRMASCGGLCVPLSDERGAGGVIAYAGAVEREVESYPNGEPDRRHTKADPYAPAIRCAPSYGYKWSVPVNPAGIAKHYLTPALAALGFACCRWHDLRHAFAVMSLSAGEHYMAVSKMLGHASFVTTLIVYADYITEGDAGKAAPLRRPVASSAGNVVPMRRPG